MEVPDPRKSPREPHKNQFVELKQRLQYFLHQKILKSDTGTIFYILEQFDILKYFDPFYRHPSYDSSREGLISRDCGLRRRRIAAGRRSAADPKNAVYYFSKGMRPKP